VATLLGNAYVRIRPDTAGFDSALTNGVGGSLKKIAGLAAAAFAGLGAVDFFKGAIDNAANAEQSIGAVQSVFKEYANGVISDSKAADRALGLSGNSYRELATLIGSQLKNAGVPMDELASKTDGLVTMGADLAAMFGGTTKDAVQAISSALKGEMDSIEKYGISLNQAALKAEALSMGLDGNVAAMDVQTKAAVIMSLINKQGADAIGQFGRESDTAAGRAQRAAAQWENLKTAIGDRLLPAWSMLMDFVGVTVIPGLGAITGVLDTVIGGFKAVWDVLANGNFSSAFRDIFGVEEDHPFVDFLFDVREGIQGLWDILVNGDFTGAFARAFGVEEDAPIVGFLLRVHDGLTGLWDLLVNGDFTGAFARAFGVHEDSAIVDFLLDIRDAFVWVGEVIQNNIGPILTGLGIALAVVFGPAVIGAIGSFIALIGTTLVGALGLLLSPTVLLVGGIAAIVAAFIAAYESSEPLREAVDRLKDAFGVFFDAFDAANGAGGVQGFFDGLVAGVKAAAPLVWAALQDIAVAFWEFLEPTIVPALQKLGGWLAAIGGWIWNTALPAIWSTLVILGNALWEWISPMIGPALEKLGEWLAALGGWIWDTGLPWLGQALWDLGQALVDWIGPRIGPMLVAIGGFLADLVGWIWNTGIPWLWDTMLSLGEKLWEWIGPKIGPMLSEIGKFLGELVGWVLFTGIPMLVGALLALSWKLIEWIVPRIPGLIAAALEFIGALVSWVFTDAIPWLAGAFWDLATGALEGLWNAFVESPVIQWIVGVFEDAVGWISDVWDDLVDKLKTPIRIVVDFINDKIIDNLNVLTEKFGLTIPNIPDNFHTGGIVPGYTPGRDTTIAAVGGGEAVMRPEWTRVMGRDYVHAANRAARNGGISGVQNFIRNGGAQFAKGGIVGRDPYTGSRDIGGPFDALGDAWNATGGKVVSGISNAAGGVIDFAGDVLGTISGAVGNAVSWTGEKIGDLVKKGVGFALEKIIRPVGNWIADNVEGVPFASDLLRGVVNKLADAAKNWGNDHQASAESHVEAERARNATGPNLDVPGGGGAPAGRGYQALFALIKRAFPEARLNSGYRPGDPGYHGSGQAVDLGWSRMPGGAGNSYMAAMNQWIYDNYRNSRELIYNGLGDSRPNLKNGRDFAYSAGTQAQHRNHVHWVYDNGGLLEPGLTTVDNRSGKPEAVLTNEEMKNYKQLIAQGGAQPLVGQLTIQVGQGADVRDGMEEAMFQLRRIQRGAGQS
jgi:hypothetical protein